MTLEAAFEHLVEALDSALKDPFTYLQRFIEDSATQRAAQKQDENKLVDNYEENVTSIIGDLAEAKLAASAGLAASKSDNFKVAKTQLIRAHGLLLDVFDHFNTAISEHKVLNCLEEQLKPAQWRKWVCSIKDSLPHCAKALRAVSNALLECWTALPVGVGSGTGPGTGDTGPSNHPVTSASVIGGMFF